MTHFADIGGTSFKVREIFIWIFISNTNNNKTDNDNDDDGVHLFPIHF